jgi:adhesin transport system membrane fusion protein
MDLMNAQIQIFNSRMKKLQDEEKLLKNELERLIYNIEEVKADINSSIEERKFLDEELQILTPLVKKGFEPRLKLIQISQRLAALDSKISKSKVAIPGIQIDIKKITQQLKNLKSDFISKAKEEIVAAKDRFNKSVLKSSQLENRLMGTQILAPVDGLISKVEISTMGAIVSSGTDLFEIIPTSDELIIEAEVRPEDIAFVRYGQKARISVTAYDPSVYGFLDGEVQNIAGNTTERPDGSKYFSARIITKSKKFDKQKNQKLEIIPGMEASVELQGDKRSVLDYILTPIKKLQREAFTEN